MAEAAGPEAFTFPGIYQFPPFFTLQPVDATRAKQLDQWKDLIVAWHSANRAASLVVNEWPHWENKTIGRKLSVDGIAAVMTHVIRCGNGEWEDSAHTRCRIFFKTPHEWASMLYAFATSAGLFGNIYTVYELHSGDVARTSELFGADPFTLHKGLEVLQSQGKAELIPGDNIDEVGVKFIAT